MYEPEEDSYLLEKQVKKYAKKGMKVLDLGTGSCIQALAAKENGAEVLAADINPEAVNLAKAKGIESIKSDLFSKVKGKYDLIILNPPYLPEEAYEDKATKLFTTGGKQGHELIERFLKEAKKHLNKDGMILLVFSTLTGNVENLFKKYDYEFKKLDSKKVFFEEIFVYELK
ncbi:methyltransferase [Candidatus Woesearchaeota archaeon]|nr:methyltransferase [Candidatus Woesearchaeota archaeon]